MYAAVYAVCLVKAQILPRPEGDDVFKRIHCSGRLFPFDAAGKPGEIVFSIQKDQVKENSREMSRNRDC